MTSTEIAELLDERFRLLTGGRRTAVERHQTLRATVDWSYSLLEPYEQLVFDRLGVFPGSFDATAGRAVAAGDGVEDWDVRDALTGLVNKSMINALTRGSGTTRYQLLETMRQYACERLDQTGDADRRRRVHAEHYAQLADNVGDAMITGESLDRWRSAAHNELDNYRAAVTWGLDSDERGDADLALRIAVSLAGLEPETRRCRRPHRPERPAARARETSTPELRAGVLVGLANDARQPAGRSRGGRYLCRARFGGRAGRYWFGVLVCDPRSLRQPTESTTVRDEILTEADRATSGLDVPHWHAYYEMLLAGVEGARGDNVAAQRHAV